MIERRFQALKSEVVAENLPIGSLDKFRFNLDEFLTEKPIICTVTDALWTSGYLYVGWCRLLIPDGTNRNFSRQVILLIQNRTSDGVSDPGVINIIDARMTLDFQNQLATFVMTLKCGILSVFLTDGWDEEWIDFGYWELERLIGSQQLLPHNKL